MAKARKTTPAEIEQIAAASAAAIAPTPEPAPIEIPETAELDDPAAEPHEAPASESPAAPVIVLEPWDSEEIQSLQINWQAKSETREIGVPLTREEIQDHATKLADTVTEIRELEDAKKANADRYKALITDQEKIQNRVSALIRQGHDTKPVPCVWLFEVAGRNDVGQFIRDPNYKTIIRKDTGAVIEVKPITADERQMGLPLDDEGPQPPDEEPDDEAAALAEAAIAEENELLTLDGDAPAERPSATPDEEVTQAMLEACYDTGMNAHAEGDTNDDNPYPKATKQWTAWENGWQDAHTDHVNA